MTAPKRSRFRWSLRTMFVVVAVFSCFPGYELNWIRQRHRFIAEEESRLDHEFWKQWQFDPRYANALSVAGHPAIAPGLLWLFGDRGYSVVWVTQNSEARIERAVRLFPEAHIATISEEHWKNAAR